MIEPSTLYIDYLNILGPVLEFIGQSIGIQYVEYTVGVHVPSTINIYVTILGTV
jgi:hypothetical protein